MNNVFIPSTWRRLVARGLDSAITTFCYLPFVKSFYLLFFTDEKVELSLAIILLMFLIPAAYEIIFLILMQATPGKWLLGLKVVPARDADGYLDWKQCLLRPLLGRFSFFFGHAIYAVAFYRYDRTHFADWVAETRVIQNSPRSSQTKVRWLLASFLIVVNFIEGVRSSSQILNEINWQEGTVDLRQVYSIELEESDFSDED